MSEAPDERQQDETNTSRPWSTLAQVADHFQISAATVYAKVHSGEWECAKLGDRIYRFSEAQIEAISSGTNRQPRRIDKARLREALKAIS